MEYVFIPVIIVMAVFVGFLIGMAVGYKQGWSHATAYYASVKDEAVDYLESSRKELITRVDILQEKIHKAIVELED